jgi:acyl-[acyl-carrier-protein]-phospholipid O-acyltransferase / long-chain-fatty-acid--[acyl-carrier-protein] ligase
LERLTLNAQLLTLKLFQQILVVYARDVAGLSVEASGYLFLLVAVGIAAGAWLSGRLSAHTIEAGLVPIGTIGLTVVFFALGMVHTLASIFPLLVLGGLSAGLCIVPLTAFLQAKAPASNRGEIFGAVEFWSFGAMVGSSALFYLFANVFHLSARTCMLVTGGISAIAAAWALMRLPFQTARFVVTRVIRFIYRIKVYGLENLPHEGGALLVANHVSYSDGVIIQSMSHRMIHPIVSRDIFATWGWCQPAFRLCGAILVHPNDGPRALVRTLNTARETLLKGDLVVIFPEGQLTRTGEMQPFKKGFEHIVKNTDIPIIPLHLGNLWGSVFSFYYGEPGIRFPRSLFRRVTPLSCGRDAHAPFCCCPQRSAGILPAGAETAPPPYCPGSADVLVGKKYGAGGQGRRGRRRSQEISLSLTTR